MKFKKWLNRFNQIKFLIIINKQKKRKWFILLYIYQMVSSLVYNYKRTYLIYGWWSAMSVTWMVMETADRWK